MRSRIKIGLMVGAIAFVLIIFIFKAAILGILLTLVAGAVAGFLASRQEGMYVNKKHPYTKKKGARTGAVAGGIAGVLTLIGQIVNMIRITTTALATGALSQASNPSWTNFYYNSALFNGLCFGIIGILFAAGAGAVAGYFSKSNAQPPETKEV